MAKFRSKRTGLTVTTAAVPGPLVKGYLTVATEALTDMGEPHTLEHLVFLGSETYPYKGVLDSLANRCLADGTNAWTDTDHTAYTITTAGAEGFLNILPIYMDHVLYPTITEEGYVTEVHHVTADGEDAGVVYNEMQGRETTQSSLAWRELLTQMYPGTCGYKSETGGIMKDIRDDLTHKIVADYHKAYYRPDNLNIFVAGMIPEKDLFAALEKFETDRILPKGALPPMTRPWSSPVTVPTASVRKEIEFPSSDESTGSVYFGWHGSLATDFVTNTALSILWTYLTDSAVSPLTKALVEIDDPYCTYVSYGGAAQSRNMMSAICGNVPTEKLGSIEKAFHDALAQTLKDGFDMERMATIIARRKLKSLTSFEQNPHDTFVDIGILDFLYATEPRHLQDWFSGPAHLDEIASKGGAFWVDLAKKYIIDNPLTTVVAKPSAALSKKLDAEKDARVEARKAKLGAEGLKALGDKLEAATEVNERPIPDGLLQKVPIPDTGRIEFISVPSWHNDGGSKGSEEVKKALGPDADKLPILVQFSSIPSAFVTLGVTIDTVSLSTAERNWLELWLEAAYSLPIERPGLSLKHEEVVSGLVADTVSYSNSLGFGGGNFSCGSHPQLARFKMTVEASKYETGLRWLSDVLWNSKFTAERLKVSAQKLLNDVPRAKRNGGGLAAAAIRELAFDGSKVNHGPTNMVRQAAFLAKVVERLGSEPDAVVAELNAFRAKLIVPSSLRLHISADFGKTVKNAATPIAKGWLPSAPSSPQIAPFNKIVFSSALKKPRGESNVLLLGNGTVDSTFWVQVGPGPQTWDDADIAPLMVLTNYLSTMEGVLWKRIRGQGLAYGASFYLRIEEGHIYLRLYRSGHPLKAYAEAEKIIGEYADKGVGAYDQVELEGARSTSVYDVISSEETMNMAAHQGFMANVHGVPATHNKALLVKIGEVKAADLDRTLKQYLMPMFDPKVVLIGAGTKDSGAADMGAELTKEHSHSVKVSEVEDGFGKL